MKSKPVQREWSFYSYSGRIYWSSRFDLSGQCDCSVWGIILVSATTSVSSAPISISCCWSDIGLLHFASLLCMLWMLHVCYSSNMMASHKKHQLARDHNPMNLSACYWAMFIRIRKPDMEQYALWDKEAILIRLTQAKWTVCSVIGNILYTISCVMKND